MASTLAEDLSKGSTHHGQRSCDGKGLSSKFPPNAPIIARAKFETDANTLNVSLANCGVILVGHPNTEQLSRNRDCEKDRLQSEYGPKEADSNDRNERQKRVIEKVESRRQLFSKGEVQSDNGQKEEYCTLNQYQTARGVVDCRLAPLSETKEIEHSDSNGTSCARVELPMASIKVKGDFSGKHREGEQLLKALELCQDNGMFVQHKRLATEKIHYYEDRKNADMVLVLKIEQAVAPSYAHIKLATILLDCCSTTARIQQKTIPPSDIKQAEDHQDIVQFKLGDFIPKGTWIQLLKTRSDQFYRQGSYNLAKETVEEAFRLASTHKFDTELNTLQEMIELFAMKLQSHLAFTEELEVSSSEAAYSASGSNSG